MKVKQKDRIRNDVVLKTSGEKRNLIRIIKEKKTACMPHAIYELSAADDHGGNSKEDRGRRRLGTLSNVKKEGRETRKKLP